MRLVFMGTPDYAAAILEELATQHEVVAVYTRVDAVRGRGKTPVASPVKELALRLGIEVRTPSTLRDAAEQHRLRELAPDIICVAAYGMLLPQEVLDIPRFGCINAHASLLPRWRGAAPIERAILAGDEEAGVCIMRMTAGLDEGDWCASRSVLIGQDNAARLTDKLAGLAASAMLVALAQIESGRAYWMAQDEAQVTYAHKIGKGELNPDPADTATLIVRKVQASSTAHPSRCCIGNRMVTLLELTLPSQELMAALPAEGIPAGFAALVAKRLCIGCADGVLELRNLKPDGKQEMTGAAFAAGLQALRAGNVPWSQHE